MAGNPRRADGNRRNKLRRWLASQRRACWICTHPIDYGLPPNHPLSFECDELVPVSVGGSPFDRDNVDAAHRCCNNWRSTRTPDTVAMIRQAVWEAYGDPGGGAGVRGVRQVVGIPRPPQISRAAHRDVDRLVTDGTQGGLLWGARQPAMRTRANPPARIFYLSTLLSIGYIYGKVQVRCSFPT